MTPDEQVRAIHRLEGGVTLTRRAVEAHELRMNLLERQMRLLVAQQNQLLAAIRGLAPTGESIAPVA